MAEDEESPAPAREQINTKLADLPSATSGLDCPLIYADLIKGAMIFNGVAKMYLMETRMDASTNELRNIHVASLVVPAPQLKSWGEFFLRIAQGEDEATAAKGQDVE
ncbi:hypothetical protein [Sphingorhabdus sp. EL138]|uniref:hypothetical protein n=1 Tax=Sphingorhabdus sp. EL138 TaxID=2073156 RepID=UPI0025FE95DE|nr:hypothetical protein [Sphingorhabdus sp. EL138]